MSIAYSPRRNQVATVDSQGHVHTSTLDTPLPPYTHTPPHTGTHERGWAGVVLADEPNGHTYTALQFQQTVNVYDKETCLRTMHTVHPVHSLTLPSAPSPLVLATEGNQVSAWDLRMGEKGGCVARAMPCAGPLYACCGGAAVVAVAGADRTVYAYDLRKWSTLGAWKGALKFDIAHVFLARDPMYGGVDAAPLCFAGSKVDGEFGCGSWSGRYEKSSRLERGNFRGDARWMGLAQVVHVDSSNSLHFNFHMTWVSRCLGVMTCSG